MDFRRHRAFAAVIAGSLVLGGAVGAAVFGPATGSAQSTTTSAPSASSGGVAAAPGRAFKPIETSSHEATESAQREGQENAGQVPTVP
jgi:hypothetical protein